MSFIEYCIDSGELDIFDIAISKLTEQPSSIWNPLAQLRCDTDVGCTLAQFTQALLVTPDRDLEVEEDGRIT